MNIFPIFIFGVLAQRVAELVIAKRHERELKKNGAVEIDKNGYRFIVGMHIAFFTSLIFEKLIFATHLNRSWVVLAVIFCCAQVLRYWAITSLGVYWNTKIIVASNHPLLKKGPYRFLRHPNYVAVIAEIAVVPLIFSCYITAGVFTVLNAVVIRRRIGIETEALAKHARIEKSRTEIIT